MMKPLGDALESSIRAKGAVAKLFGSPEMEFRFVADLTQILQEKF